MVMLSQRYSLTGSGFYYVCWSLEWNKNSTPHLISPAIASKVVGSYLETSAGFHFEGQTWKMKNHMLRWKYLITYDVIQATDSSLGHSTYFILEDGAGIMFWGYYGLSTVLTYPCHYVPILPVVYFLNEYSSFFRSRGHSTLEIRRVRQRIL